MHRGSNGLDHAVDIVEHIVVPEPENSESFTFEPLRAHRITPAIDCVLAAVRLNDQFLSVTDEVDDVTADGSLPAKQIAAHLAAA